MPKYCGREFDDDDLKLIRRLIEEDATRTRAELSRLTCRALNWRKPDGGLKDMSCRVAMLRMHRDGLIRLPPPRRKKATVRVRITARSDPGPPIRRPVHELGPLTFSQIKGSRQSSLWNEYIERYHYLGYTLLPGAQIRYRVDSQAGLVALLGFSAAAWQTAPRDRFIGWIHERRKQNLRLIVNNSRYLIPPWVESPNLASKVLALACRRLPEDWLRRYGYRPVLAETFVDGSRFAGTCYKAANWIRVGRTTGRGKLGPAKKISVPIKDVWLYPLHPDFRRILSE